MLILHHLRNSDLIIRCADHFIGVCSITTQEIGLINLPLRTEAQMSGNDMGAYKESFPNVSFNKPEFDPAGDMTYVVEASEGY